MVNPSPLCACTPAHPGFIGLDVLCGLAADTVRVGPHPTDPELVEYLEGGFVARQSELPLKLDGRHAGCLTGDQVGRPEPYRERRVRALHDSAGGESSFAPTLAATENARAGGVTIGFTGRPAVGTDEAVTPSCALKVCRARRFVREQAMELRQRARERQIISLEYVDRHACPKLIQMLNILPVVGVCDNRISTECCTTR